MLKPNRIIFWTCLLYVCIPLVIQANNLTENCQPITQTERGTLVSQTFIKTILAQNINSLFPEKNQHKGDISQLPKYDIDLYNIIYTSIHAGELVQLSGLIIVPKKEGMLPHLQYHHGTMLPYPYGHGEGSLDAPSLYDGNAPKTVEAQYETRLFGNYLGSYGYLMSFPDYSGYAVSEQLEHPYSVNTMLAEQSVDMILATRAFCHANNIILNNQLFLAGWSEGGAACVATQKLIEAEYGDQITVTANAPLAGFYYTLPLVKQFLNFTPLLFKDYGEDLDVLIWTSYTINKYSTDPIPTNKLFKYPVNNQLDVLKNRPTSRPRKLYKWLGRKSKKQILSQFSAQCLHDNWTPIAPIFVHHGTKDDIVYYDKNVEVMVNNLNQRNGKITLRKYEGHNHYSLAFLYLLSMVEDFDALPSINNK